MCVVQYVGYGSRCKMHVCQRESKAPVKSKHAQSASQAHLSENEAQAGLDKNPEAIQEARVTSDTVHAHTSETEGLLMSGWPGACTHILTRKSDRIKCLIKATTMLWLCCVKHFLYQNIMSIFDTNFFLVYRPLQKDCWNFKFCMAQSSVHHQITTSEEVSTC